MPNIANMSIQIAEFLCRSGGRLVKADPTSDWEETAVGDTDAQVPATVRPSESVFSSGCDLRRQRSHLRGANVEQHVRQDRDDSSRCWPIAGWWGFAHLYSEG